MRSIKSTIEVKQKKAKGCKIPSKSNKVERVRTHEPRALMPVTTSLVQNDDKGHDNNLSMAVPCYLIIRWLSVRKRQKAAEMKF